MNRPFSLMGTQVRPDPDGRIAFRYRMLWPWRDAVSLGLEDARAAATSYSRTQEMKEIDQKYRLLSGITDAFFTRLLSPHCRDNRPSFRQKCQKARDYIRQIIRLWLK